MVASVGRCDDVSNACEFRVLLEKVLRIYGDLNGELHLVELQRSRASACLGLSLAGNRDVATMSVFVFDIEPTSLVGRDGHIHIGDELLEVM